MRDLELVIFDCDGVLVDSEVISNRVLARAAPKVEQGASSALDVHIRRTSWVR
jgi:beta-phosphoglucomutase-like phosphatase (HAD superfamily)